METVPFQARREVARFSHRVSAPAAVVFPLLCPVREHDWIEGWSAQTLYSESGVAEKNGVFLARYPDHSEALFFVTRHDAQAGAVEFVVLRPGLYVEKLDLALTDHGDGTTTVGWTRTYTGLTEAGNQYIQRHVDQDFETRMQGLHRSLQSYLTRQPAP